MKIGRNDPCNCGSGKKYKKCCLLVKGGTDYEKIRRILEKAGYKDSLSSFVCNLYRYMRQKNWIGACHATSAILYIGMMELGYSPKICIGEVETSTIKFDHSWIELEGKVIDLAISKTLMGGAPLAGAIILDIEIDKNKKPLISYGVRGGGLDGEALFASELPVVEYMDMYPDDKNGLWGIFEHVYPEKISTNIIKQKYLHLKREYIVNT